MYTLKGISLKFTIFLKMKLVVFSSIANEHMFLAYFFTFKLMRLISKTNKTYSFNIF